MVLRLQQCRADNLAVLKRQNESVLDMLARERVASDALRQRCEELEADLQECGTTYEVLAHFSHSRPDASRHSRKVAMSISMVPFSQAEPARACCLVHWEYMKQLVSLTNVQCMTRIKATGACLERRRVCRGKQSTHRHAALRNRSLGNLRYHVYRAYMQVKLEDARLQQTEAENKLRQVQAGTNFSDVFQRYETVISQLQTDRNSLQKQNDVLARQVVQFQVGRPPVDENSPPFGKRQGEHLSSLSLAVFA